jgi:hypothetical protein
MTLTSAERRGLNFREIETLGSWVNRGEKEGRGYKGPRPTAKIGPAGCAEPFRCLTSAQLWLVSAAFSALTTPLTTPLFSAFIPPFTASFATT